MTRKVGSPSPGNLQDQRCRDAIESTEPECRRFHLETVRDEKTLNGAAERLDVVDIDVRQGCQPPRRRSAPAAASGEKFDRFVKL